MLRPVMFFQVGFESDNIIKYPDSAFQIKKLCNYAFPVNIKNPHCERTKFFQKFIKAAKIIAGYNNL